MSYHRVVPRDFFNEAKLLKCLGRLTLLIGDELAPKGIRYNELLLRDGFKTRLNYDATLEVTTFLVNIHDRRATFYTYINSRGTYPLFARYYDSNEEVEVFTDEGEFTQEFLDFCKKE